MLSETDATVITTIDMGTKTRKALEIERPRNSGPLDVLVRAPGFLPFHTRLHTDRPDTVLRRSVQTLALQLDVLLRARRRLLVRSLRPELRRVQVREHARNARRALGFAWGNGSVQTSLLTSLERGIGLPIYLAAARRAGGALVGTAAAASAPAH